MKTPPTSPLTPKPNRKGLKADYGKATPEQVAKALHRYRPGRSVTRETWRKTRRLTVEFQRIGSVQLGE